MEKGIIEKGSFKEVNGVKILNMKGEPYEMGYQHGYYLAGGINLMINRTLLATAAYVAEQTGTDPQTAYQMLWAGQQAAQPFLPEEFVEEMEGIVDGAKAAGITVSLEQIMLWNTNYDQWCIYCHPHHWQPGGVKAGALSGSRQSSGGCSSFCAWDEWAGGDGKLIFGKDEDNFNMPEQLDNRTLMVADPDNGFGHAFLSYPGMIGLDGGMNTAGFEMMTQLNSMQYETMEGCGIGIFTRLLLTYASTVEGATKTFQRYPRCAGIAYHVADANAKQAAVVETSSKMVTVRYPDSGVKAMWQSNHSNCYPGWMGYSGYNMVADQAPVNELTDISTIDNWQKSLRDPNNLYVQAPSRFERYEELVNQYKGNITPENAITILSDRFDPYTGKTRDKYSPSISNNILCTICALYPDMSFHAEEPVGDFKAHIANMWSLVSYPETGDMWLAINDFPAQYGGYEHFNLNDLLTGTN
jgi:predicted choloylglycine hydrolase